MPGEASTVSPALSVVIICFTTPDHLRRALTALAQQDADVPLEVIVPHDDTLAGVTALAAEFPQVSFLRVGARVTPAALRTQGTRASHAPVVGYLEDHCVPTMEWATAVLRSHREPHAAVGGCIDKGFLPGATDDTALNWAIYLTDYSRYMSPMAAGQAHGLSDCNVSYKRSALDRIADVWATEFHENLVNGRLAQAGESLWFDPALRVLEQRTLTLRGALGDRFSFGRLFGSSRVHGAPLARRLLLAVAAPAMTPLLVTRVHGNLRTRGRRDTPFVRALPYLVLVAGTWLLGESVGYLTGRAGRSLSAPSA